MKTLIAALKPEKRPLMINILKKQNGITIIRQGGKSSFYAAVPARLTEQLRKVPSDAGYYGVATNEHGNPRVEEGEKAL